MLRVAFDSPPWLDALLVLFLVASWAWHVWATLQARKAHDTWKLASKVHFDALEALDDVDPSVLGQRAFEAYGRSTGGKTFDGRDIPKWDDLPSSIRRAWRAAACAVQFERLSRHQAILEPGKPAANDTTP
jgi:hypothetical protein